MSDSQQAEQISRPQPRAENMLKMTLRSAQNLHERTGGGGGVLTGIALVWGGRSRYSVIVRGGAWQNHLKY